jgi:murein DD-endopeptidase MepM/ murein hydrolase activator NlpD
MKWPVQGPVLSTFGPKGQGLNNDGVNIGAPKGAPVVAAANGIVVYAGNEMKGFGNLVLIRHTGGWVTAYAHLDRTLVNKDAVVAQGDMIGTVGKTGNVPSPQLHFETRLEGKPVDPATVIKAQ